MKSFNPSQPVYIGFSGPAGSGKTSTAKKIVPPPAVTLLDDPASFPDLVWAHYWLSQPLYELANVKTQTIGDESHDRQLYVIHDVVNALMQRRIPYDDMIELVYDLYAMPINTSEDEKPRTFLQDAGDLCRAHYEDCFADYVKYKIYNAWRAECLEYDRHDLDAPWYLGIVEDIRCVNEAKMIKAQKNNILIKLVADPRVLRQRLLERDGRELAPTNAAHHTENSFDLIPNEDFDLILDTTDMSVDDQAEAVYDYITRNHNFEVTH